MSLGSRISSARSNRLPDAIGVALATALAGLLTRPIWTTNSSPGGFDNLFYTGPIQTALTSAWRNLEPPYWFPDIFLGVPTLSNPQTYAFYPISQVFNVILGVPRSMDASIIFHTLLLVYGCYFLGRRGLRVAPLPALVLTVTVCCCTAFMVNYGRIEQIQVLSWMPWITATILIAARALESRDIRRIVRDYAVLGTLLGLAFMAGHPQSFLMVGVVAIVVFIAAMSWHPKSLIIAIGTTIVGFTALAGIAIQGLLHGMALTAPQNRTPADLVGFSLNLRNLPGALFPPSTSPYPFNESGNFETTGSVSLAALILAILCILLPATRRMTRVRRSFLLLSLGGIAWAIIPTVPALAGLHNAVPLLANERVPGRWLVVAIFSLACLAALGLDGALKRRQWLMSPWRLGCFFLLLVAIAVTWGLSNRQGATESIFTAALGVILLAAYWRTRSSALTGRQALILMIAASAITYSLLIGKTTTLTRTSSTFAQTTVNSSPISEHIQRFPGPTLSLVPDDFSSSELMLKALRPNSGLYLPSPSLDGYDGGFWVTERWVSFAESNGIITSSRFVRDLTLGHQLSWTSHTISVLQKIGTRYVLVPESVHTLPALNVVASDNQLKLVALPDWRGAGWLCQQGLNLGSCSSDPPMAGLKRIDEQNAIKLTFPALHEPHDVVLPIQFDSYWSAVTPQGVAIKTYPHDDFLLGVRVPSETQEVRLAYSPPYASVLITTSLLWMVILTVLLIRISRCSPYPRY
jgi:hypothetical protein